MEIELHAIKSAIQRRLYS